jgi:CHAT domain-containing protein
MRRLVGGVVLCLVCLGSPVSVPSAQSRPEADAVLQEADRLAWLRAWGAAEPLYLRAQREFTERGDSRNALYAEISAIRGQLPRLSIAEASTRLAAYLDHPRVRTDDRLRLRCLIIKAETDEDLDPSLSRESWREAQSVAEKLGEAGWANRAKAELGLVAFLLGDVDASVLALAQAVKVAQSNGDVSSVVRWLTLFGLGYAQLGRHEEALDFYARALKAASAVPELPFPVMTHLGRSRSLIRLGRIVEAERVLAEAAPLASRAQAVGYEAQLIAQRALIANQAGRLEESAGLYAKAAGLARQVRSGRILAEVALESTAPLRALRRETEATAILSEGIAAARGMEERWLLPRLLAALGELRSSQGRPDDAAALLEEATDVLEGLFSSVSSPWARARVINGMNDVLLARIRLEASAGRPVARLYDAVEQARGRAFLQLLEGPTSAQQATTPEWRDGTRRVAALQRQLLRTSDRRARRRLLDEIFAAEEALAPAATTLFGGRRRGRPTRPPSLQAFQKTLQRDEVFLEFVTAEPNSHLVIVTRSTSRRVRLPRGTGIRAQVIGALKAVRAEADAANELNELSRLLLGDVKELASKQRVIVSPDGELHHLPFELLTGVAGRPLLDTHVVSYVASGSVLAAIRSQGAPALPTRGILAIASSPAAEAGPARAGSASRGIYDVVAPEFRPLPGADDEVDAIATTFGGSEVTVLKGDAASEDGLKRQRVGAFRALHFAAHGLPSSKFPARAALLLRPGGPEDGVLQAREILTWRLAADLVTLSACETGAGDVLGQEGVASLVRPFLAAGAGAVVANLWDADDTFSLALMREFYGHLAAGHDVALALTTAKRAALARFGSEARRRLWSGVLAYGDGRRVVANAAAPAAGQE